MKRKLVYVAGPISKGDLTENIRASHDAGIALLKAGLSAIVPHGTCFWGNRTDYGLNAEGFIPETLPAGITHDDWVGMDLEIVRRCDAVLRLRGESKGADLEEEEAIKNGIPVFFNVGDVIAWALATE